MGLRVEHELVQRNEVRIRLQHQEEVLQRLREEEGLARVARPLHRGVNGIHGGEAIGRASRAIQPLQHCIGPLPVPVVTSVVPHVVHGLDGLRSQKAIHVRGLDGLLATGEVEDLGRQTRYCVVHGAASPRQLRSHQHVLLRHNAHLQLVEALYEHARDEAGEVVELVYEVAVVLLRDIEVAVLGSLDQALHHLLHREQPDLQEPLLGLGCLQELLEQVLIV
mmetsp:Transcript_76366/g.196661  ORF Transcript_76366/g.196661 Transcript_76366/m.196661 type:complete len:222 (-) Transcript_76366:700-1365(-)